MKLGVGVLYKPLSSELQFRENRLRRSHFTEGRKCIYAVLSMLCGRPIEVKLCIRGLHMTLLDIMRCNEIGARKAVPLS
jgi:hypothetical protein